MKRIIEKAALLGLTAVLILTGCTSEIKTSDTTNEDLNGSASSVTSVTVNKAMVRLNLTEDQILNMTDEEFTEYGMLLIDYRIEDVQRPNPQRDEFGFRREDGYRYPGMPAERSASSYEEALGIAKSEWQNNDYNTYKDIKLLGENDKFWLFKCTNYYRGEYNMILTKAVYKKDYFDEETSTAYFELNEESIRTFFAYRAYDVIDNTKTCIGEFVTKTDDGYIFRSYSMYICYGDYGINDEANLFREEWTISNDGKFTLTQAGNIRELELPVSSIGEYPD